MPISNENAAGIGQPLQAYRVNLTLQDNTLRKAFGVKLEGPLLKVAESVGVQLALGLGNVEQQMPVLLVTCM